MILVLVVIYAESYKFPKTAERVKFGSESMLGHNRDR